MIIALFASVALLPAHTMAFSTSDALQECVVVADVLQAAKALVDDGRPDPAAALLEGALARCPDHAELLADLAGIRVLQGDLVRAEALATRLVRFRPESNYAWNLLALTRYLQDDAAGALRAWSHAGRPLVDDVTVRLVSHDGPRTSSAGPDPDRVSGITEGRVLTEHALLRGERRLAALPAADRARLGYGMTPEGEARVDGTVVLGATNPFSGPDLVLHALRLFGRRVHLVSADPMGRLERWNLSGTVEGSLFEAGIAVAHPAPGGRGAWRWGITHETGRYGSAGVTDTVRETRTSLAWSHTDWVTATLRGSVHSRVDLRPERGTFVGVGAGWSLVPRTARGAIGAEGTGWLRIQGVSSAGSGRGERRFGRVEVRGVFHAVPASRHWSGVGLDLRGGIVAVSDGTPPDLMPRVGAGGNAHLLMRARSDLDDRGAVRAWFPGTAWAHATIEVHREVAAVGPAAIGVALFADGVSTLAPAPQAGATADRRRALHLGGGLRTRIPWVDGWLRADWSIDPSDGASTFSAAWVQEHRLHRAPAR